MSWTIDRRHAGVDLAAPRSIRARTFTVTTVNTPDGNHLPTLSMQQAATEKATASTRTDEGESAHEQLTPTAGRLLLQMQRPSVSAALDLARARGKAAAGTGEPSQMPGDPAIPPLYVGSGAHANDLPMLKRLGSKRGKLQARAPAPQAGRVASGSAH